MADLTGTFRTPSGNFTVTITDAGAAATMKVVDIGEITYEYDITPDQTDISKIVALYASVNIKLYLYDQTGNDLYDRLTNTTQNPVLLTASFFDGSTGYYRFQHRPADVTIDELSKTVTVKCQPWKLTTTMRDFFTNANYAGDLLTFQKRATNGTAFTYQAVSAGRFSYRILNELNAGNTQYNSSAFDQSLFTVIATGFTPEVYANFGPAELTPINTNGCFVLVNVDGLPQANGVPINIANISALNVLAELAVSEGAIVGSGVAPFYKPRAQNTAPVTINYSDLLDLKYEQSFMPLQSVDVVVDGPKLNTVIPNRNLPAMGLGFKNEVINPQALRAVTLDLYPAYPLLSVGVVNSVAAINVNAEPVDSGEGQAADGVAAAGATQYALSLGGSSGKIVAGRIRGVTKTKPYDVIQFGSDTPARYQGTNFRPTYLSYDFKSDEVKFKAYSID